MDLETFRKLAADRRVIPVTRKLLADGDTPVALYRKLAGERPGTFLLESAELLDRVGLRDQAGEYLQVARERDVEDDEEVMQTTAVLRARSGDPVQALDELQELVRGEWLEKRLVWRHSLLTAWATFRAGRDGATGPARGGENPGRVAHGGDDLGMAVSEDRAHLAGGEIQHAAACGIVDETALGPHGNERHEAAAVAQHVALRARPECGVRGSHDCVHDVIPVLTN